MCCGRARTTSSRAVRRSASPSGSAVWSSSRCGPAPRALLLEQAGPGQLLPADRRAPGVGAVHRADRVPGDARRGSTTGARHLLAAPLRVGGREPARGDLAGLVRAHRPADHQRHRRHRAAAHLHLRRRRGHPPRHDGRSGAGLAGARGRTTTASRSPDGEPGLLAVRGPVGCRYLADPRQREYVRDGWNITGDTYVRDPDGYFRYVARADDMIISAGYNIAGPEVEEALLRHPDVAGDGGGRAGRTRRAGRSWWPYAVLREGARRGPRTTAPCGLRQRRAGPATSARARSSSWTRCRGPRPASSSGSGCRGRRPVESDRLE